MHHIRGWVWSGDTLDVLKIRKSLLPLLGVKVVLPNCPAPNLVIVPTERSCLLGKRLRTVLPSDSSAEHFYGFHGKSRNKWTNIWIRAKNSKYISKYNENLCSAIGSTGVNYVNYEKHVVFSFSDTRILQDMKNYFFVFLRDRKLGKAG